MDWKAEGFPPKPLKNASDAGFYFYEQDHVTIEKPTLPKVETH